MWEKSEYTCVCAHVGEHGDCTCMSFSRFGVGWESLWPAGCMVKPQEGEGISS